MTFQPTDWWTSHSDRAGVKPRLILVWDKQVDPDEYPCTIIPGHWAERIESGELLTIDERGELEAKWINSEVHVGAWEYMMQAIARKLRGEA